MRTRAGTDLGITAVTVETYAKVLEAVFLVQRLPAWRNTLTSRAAASPKIHVVDSVIAAHLLRLTPEKLARKDATSVTEFAGNVSAMPRERLPYVDRTGVRVFT